MTDDDGNSDTTPDRRHGATAAGHHTSVAKSEPDIDWAAVPARAAELADDHELLDVIQAAVDGSHPAELTSAVHAAIVDALALSVRPGLVNECLLLLLDSRSALEHIGNQLYSLCVGRARPPVGEPTPMAWLLAADALEAATRLALGGWAPRLPVLAELVQAPVPAPSGYARAALRCLSASFEHWRDPDLLDTLNRFAGVTPGNNDTEPAADWAWQIAPDAAYELGCASLLQALGEDDLADVEEHLTSAAVRLQVAANDREDAALIGAVVKVLTASLPTEAGRAAYAATDFAVLADTLQRGVTEHVLGSIGLNHWRAPRLDAEVAWSQLVRDVARTQSALTEPSWYQAETTLAHVLAAWTASRCSRVLRREDHVAVRAILGPNIVGGIAVQAGLMKHLEDHIAALEADGEAVTTRPVIRSRASDDVPETGDIIAAELEAARSLLAQARTRLSEGGGHPKCVGSAAVTSSEGDAPALPLLTELLGGGGEGRGVRDALTALPPEVARELESALRQKASDTASVIEVDARGSLRLPFAPEDDVVITDTFLRLTRQLSGSAWYVGEIQEVLNHLLLLLLRFWRSRNGQGPATMPYLFKADAKEEDLARDLKAFFDGTAMAQLINTEVRNHGGGRVDVLCSLPRFELVIELKKDDRQIDMAQRRKELAQTVAYQSAGVPLGFLAVLDLRPRTGSPPHLTSCFGVEVLDDPDLGEPRYVVTMAVPGNRTIPSAMK